MVGSPPDVLAKLDPLVVADGPDGLDGDRRPNVFSVRRLALTSNGLNPRGCTLKLPRCGAKLNRSKSWAEPRWALAKNALTRTANVIVKEANFRIIKFPNPKLSTWSITSHDQRDRQHR